MPRHSPLALAMLAWTGAVLAAEPLPGEAPFGLAWGALDRVPYRGRWYGRRAGRSWRRARGRTAPENW